MKITVRGLCFCSCFCFGRLRSGPFEGPATVKPPALPVDTYFGGPGGLSRLALVFLMLSLMAWALWAGSVESGQARMPLVPVRHPEKRAPYWVPVMKLVWSQQMPAQVSGLVWAML